MSDLIQGPVEALHPLRPVDAIQAASRLLHMIADRVGDRFDYVIADAAPFRDAADALDKIVMEGLL